MSLIQEHNREADPRNNTQPVEVPRIIQSTPRATTTKPTPSPAAQMLETPLSAPRGPGPRAEEILTNSSGQEMLRAASDQARQEVDWQRNQLRNAPVEYRAPLYRSNLGNSWTNSLPQLNIRPPESESGGSLEDKLARYFEEYGEDAPNPFRNALAGNNNVVGRTPNPNRVPTTRADIQAPGWLQRIVRGGNRVLGLPGDLIASGLRRVSGGRIGQERQPSELMAAAQIELLEEGVAQFGAVGGQVIQLAEMIGDVAGGATGMLFDQTLGRAIYGSAQQSQAVRDVGRQDILARRETGYFAPARDLATQYGEGTEGNNVMRAEFGAYGRGLPGAVNMSTDYVGNVIRAGGYSGWRRLRTVHNALNGIERPHDYAGDFDPLRRALNPLDNSEIYSFFDDPKYSPLSMMHRLPEQSGPPTARRQLQTAALMAAGFLFDMRTPEPATLSRLARLARRGMAATTTVSAAQDVASLRRSLPGRPDAPRLSGTTRPLELPPGPAEFRTNPLTPDVSPRPPGDAPIDLSGGAMATPDYEALFTTPDGVVLELPRDMLRRSDDFVDTRQSVLSQPFPDEPAPPLIQDPVVPSVFESQRRALEDAFGEADEIMRRTDDPDAPRRSTFDETVDEVEPSDDIDASADEMESLFNRADEIENDAQRTGRWDDAETQRQRDALEEASTPEPAPDEAPTTPDAPEASTRLPDEQPEVEPTRPVREPGSAEGIVARAIDEGDVVDTPRGLVNASDEVREAQYQLINNRMLYRNIQNVPEANRTPSMRRTLENLETEFNDLRGRIAGREFRSIAQEPVNGRVVDTELPIVSQQSLTPPAEPAKLYQWSRNLPEGQRIYTADARIVERSAKELTEVARFLGHIDLPRGRVLNPREIADLRKQYGPIYGTMGPQIDSPSLARLNGEGVGRVESVRPDPVVNEPGVSRVVSNDVARDPANRTATPEEFGNPKVYSQDQLSRLSDESLQSELDTRFSPAEVYRSGRPNRDVADTRNDLLQEAAYRRGENVDDVLEFFPDDLTKYAEMNGIELADLSREEYLEVAKASREDANLRASVDVNATNTELPDELQSPTLSSEAQDAIRELVVAETNVEDAMVVVRDRVAVLEELERATEEPMRALEASTDTNNLLPNTLATGHAGRTRQAAVDVVADAASAEARNITQNNTSRGRLSTPQFEFNKTPAEAEPGTVFYETATPEQRRWMLDQGQNYMEPVVATRSELDATFPDLHATAEKARAKGYTGSDDYEVVARWMSAGAMNEGDELRNIWPVHFTDAPDPRWPSASMSVDEVIQRQSSDTVIAFGDRVEVEVRYVNDGEAMDNDPLQRKQQAYIDFSIDGDYSEARRQGGIPRETIEARRWMRELLEREGETTAFLGSPGGRSGPEVYKKYEMYHDAGFRAIDVDTNEIIQHRMSYEEYGQRADIVTGTERENWIGNEASLVVGLEMVHIPKPSIRETQFFHGTRTTIEDITTIDPYQHGRTRQPLGAGEYFYESPGTAEAAAGAFIPVNDVGHLPIGAQGRVTPVALSVDTTLDGSLPLNADPQLWEGIRNLIKEAFPRDTRTQKNAMAAARRNGLPAFYDYMATKFTTGASGGVDEVRMFEFQTRLSNYFRSQGIEAITWDGPDGRIVNVLPGPDGRLPVLPGQGVDVSGPGVIDQATASANFAQAELRAFGTESARQASEQSAYRFAMQLRRQMTDLIGEAADRVDFAFDRLVRADDALADIASRDVQDAQRIQEAADAERYRRVQERLNEGRNCL